MTLVTRLKTATGLMALAAAVVTAYVWGDPTGERNKKSPLMPDAGIVSPNLTENLAAGKFSRMPVLTYETQGQETLFALQLKPSLDPVSARPRDIVIVVDTSASQAGTALNMAKRIAEDVVNDAGPNDRVAIWTINTPAATRSLGTGLQLRTNGRAVHTAVEKLKAEYASGAVDLKGGLEKVIKDFEGKQSRHQILLFLGDGESAYEPMTEKDRYALADKMLGANISFYTVPLGLHLHPTNLHALVSGTGGAVVRIQSEEAKDPSKPQPAIVGRLNKAFNVPVLIPSNMNLSVATAELYPSKLPPLRADQPTLVVGKFVGAKPQKLEATIEGKVGGKVAKVSVVEGVPPSTSDHYFLNTLIGQWRDSAFKDAPALLRADRSLALAYQQTRLALDELNTQAQWAIGAVNYDAAKGLFDAARKLDPNDPEAVAGIKVVEKLKKGEITREQFKALQAPKTGLAFERQADGRTAVVRVNLQELAQDPKEAKVDPAPKGPTNAGDDLLRQEQARRAVLEQQVKSTAEETMDRARRLLREGDPDSAKDLIVQQRDSVRGNPDISDNLRQRLDSQMELLLRQVGTTGARIRQQLAEERERIARARAKILAGDQKAAAEERTRDRIKALVTLMQQARFEDAYREAQVLQQERLTSGEPLLLEAQATYQIGQAAANLREVRELVRIREDRFLLSMMQVEKSHIPYPDEPPVHFPPSKVWRDLLELRKKYAQTDFEGDLPPKVQRRLGFLKESLNTSLPLDKPIESPLKEVIDYLEDVSSPPESARDPSLRVKIIANDAAFKAARGENFKIEEETVRLPKLTGASLSTALRILTAQFGGTYIVRRDYIELTTAEEAIRDKVIRAFPVADLVVPIPNGIAQQALNQNLSVLGQTFSLGGGNAFGVTGAFGGNFGGQGGQFFGGQGGNQGGNQAQGNNIGNLFQGQNVNLGVQGGVAGFGGGQLGQFGNLGGQFGFQGGTQDALLIALIVEVIARGEWAQAPGVLGGISVTQQGNNTGAVDPALDPANNVLPIDQLNSLGYYPPARALVVRGTSRFHKSQATRLAKTGMGVAAGQQVVNATPNVIEGVGNVLGNLGGNGGGNVAKKPENRLLRPDEVVKLVDPGLRKHQDKDWDAKKVWDKELAKGITDAGTVVACVDFLSRFGSFSHASELLKASLRKGLTVEPWTQEALAIALEEGQGSREEIERARLSAIDLEPTNAQAYLKASRVLSDAGDQERAMSFCKLAAKLQPDMPDPYLNAMAYAGDAKKIDADVSVWAADSILRRDWPLDSKELHAAAKKHLAEIAGKLAKENRPTDAKKVQDVLDGERERDLVIKMKWSGEADLDLKVSEAIGTLCSAKQKQTTAGGILLGDDLLQKDADHSETYMAAQAFDGTYRVSIDRVWGRPLGNKVTLEVIRNQGTPKQSVEIHTVNLDKDASLTIKVEGGRRKELATIPPVVPRMGSAFKADQQEQAANKFKAMTDPGYAGLSGGFGVPASRATGSAFVPEGSAPAVGVAYQTRVREAVPGGLEMQITANYAADPKDAHWKLSPVFQTAGSKGTVKLALIPGSGD